MESSGEILRVEGITKSFPGVLAVDNVSFNMNKGEILALLGENGAGKSTLTQTLGGVLKPDSGTIMLEGEPVAFSSPADAIRAGIGMVFQELSLVGSLSVAENIFANRQPTGPLDNVRWSDLYRQTREFLREFNLDLDPKRPVKYLSMGRQQMLEILKALSTRPRLLILDEPTSSLTESETEQLFEIIRKLRAEGMSFIYITHKLPEVFAIADQVMVMRDGKFIGKQPVSAVTDNDLISMMVGRKITQLYGSTGEREHGPEVLRVEGLTRAKVFHDVSFSLRKGEILGFAGLVGAGRTEVGRAIVGADRKDSGRVFLNGREVRIHNPADAIEHKIAYLTEDRKAQGLFLNMSVRDNLLANALGRFASALGFLNGREMDRQARADVEEFKVATPAISKRVLNLSGGNQQKVLLAEWLGIQPEVIILDEPTRGVDVGARADIYQKIREYAEKGTGVVIISSDLPELIGMCDRILVMHHGRITGEVERERFSEELIISYAAGLGGITGAGSGTETGAAAMPVRSALQR
jgi:ABC-type sugar transport system ATPase subunit